MGQLDPIAQQSEMAMLGAANALEVLLSGFLGDPVVTERGD